jgi:penicillin-binding protein 2B
VINDDQGHHLGKVSVEQAFAHSSNVGAVQLSRHLETNRFVQYIRDFGFLARTDIECAERTTNRIEYRDGRTNVVLSYGESSGRISAGTAELGVWLRSA